MQDSFKWTNTNLNFARNNPSELMAKGITLDYASSIEEHDAFEMLSLSKSIYSMSISELDEVKALLEQIDYIENHDYSFLCPQIENGVTAEILDKMTNRLENITELMDYGCEITDKTTDEEIENLLQSKQRIK